ncbi:MAG: MmoB/DmpM family protein [Panacagrimonas sp.]
MSKLDSGHINNMVGPIMRSGALAKAVAEAAEIDNPDKTILFDDKVAYLRIQTEGEMMIRRATVEEMLGKPFRMSELEIDLSSFAGRIDTHMDYVRFYFDKKL